MEAFSSTNDNASIGPPRLKQRGKSFTRDSAWTSKAAPKSRLTQRWDMGGRIAAVVTGAGSGLGRDVVMVLAARGCDVTIVDIDASAGESVRRDCEAKGVAAHFIEADLLASGAAERIIGRAIDLTGSIGILVNNA